MTGLKTNETYNNLSLIQKHLFSCLTGYDSSLDLYRAETGFIKYFLQDFKKDRLAQVTRFCDRVINVMETEIQEEEIKSVCDFIDELYS